MRYRPFGRLKPMDKDVYLRKGRAVTLLLLDDHRLDGRGDAVLDLDVDHAGADRADRLLEVDLAAIDLDAASLLDRVDDVLRRDRAEQAAVVAGLVGDREHRAAEHGSGVLGALVRLRGGALARLERARGGGDRALGRGLGQLARDQVVAQVALRDVDDRAAAAELLVVLQEDRLRHDASRARARGHDRRGRRPRRPRRARRPRRRTAAAPALARA